MYLEHVNLVVPNIDDMLKFYRAAFPHWHVRDEGFSDWYGKSRKWLHFGDDEHYIAFCDNGEGVNRDLTGHSVGLAHFAYVTNDLAAVIDRLTNAGYDISNPGATEPFRKNVYFIDPAGFEVEFVEYQWGLLCT
ncbi:VOC family protein [Methylophaga sp. SB9B]|uniref:VOC family protein n=1 Tax=Methylophaga sp. SB9B TaxID=2570356 RepID=UPI0010A83D2B|nr:VOC family protein [Methylophaga sp. SB9B]THK42610.1 VOC family protein [Methylophaga sp. SB9B]